MQLSDAFLLSMNGWRGVKLKIEVCFVGSMRTRETRAVSSFMLDLGDVGPLLSETLTNPFAMNLADRADFDPRQINLMYFVADVEELFRKLREVLKTDLFLDLGDLPPATQDPHYDPDRYDRLIHDKVAPLRAGVIAAIAHNDVYKRELAESEPSS